MKIKIIGPVIAIIFFVVAAGANAESRSANEGIPGKLIELQTTVNNLVSEVTNLLSLKDDVKSLKDELATANKNISKQQTEIESLKQLNEKLLSKFNQNDRGDLYFEDKLLVKKDTVVPEPISNLRIVSATPDEIKISFDPSISTDVANYRIELGHVMDGKITTVDIGLSTEYVINGLNLSNPDPNYYVKVIAIDGHDNVSEYTSKNFEVIPHIPPVVSGAYIQGGTNGTGIELWFGDIKYADSFDVYIDGELKTTIQGNEGSYFLDGPIYVEHIIKIVARNNYGTSEKVVKMFFPKITDY